MTNTTTFDKISTTSVPRVKWRIKTISSVEGIREIMDILRAEAVVITTRGNHSGGWMFMTHPVVRKPGGHATTASNGYFG